MTGASLLAIAGFFLPWLLVLYGVQLSADLLPGARTKPIWVYVPVLASTGYDLAFGRVNVDRIGGDTDEVEGRPLFLAFLIAPAVLAALPIGHAVLRVSRADRATPAVVGLAAALLAGLLLHQMYFDLENTIRTEAMKRVDTSALDETSDQFRILAEESIPMHRMGFWMALFGYAGILSGAIHWYGESRLASESTTTTANRPPRTKPTKKPTEGES